jgi:hypothetical protein
MGREHLSSRFIQPGHDRSFELSEENFIRAARLILPSNYDIIPKPRDLADLFEGFGMIPEAMIISRDTGRFVFVEVKKQGDSGNAEERVYKLFTTRFKELIHEKYGLNYHPFVAVFCENLATDERYTKKFDFMMDPRPAYCLWVDYRLDVLAVWLDAVCETWLD